MDEKYLEQADELMQAEIAAGIARVRADHSRNLMLSHDGLCSCGEEIPKARLGLGYHRCLDCQSKLEKGRQFNR